MLRVHFTGDILCLSVFHHPDKSLEWAHVMVVSCSSAPLDCDGWGLGRCRETYEGRAKNRHSGLLPAPQWPTGVYPKGFPPPDLPGFGPVVPGSNRAIARSTRHGTENT